MSRWASWGIAGLWLVLFVWSFISVQMTEPMGSGFTRGFNRLGGFFLYQAIAMGLALFGWILGNASGQSPNLAVRAVRYVPLIVSGLFWLIVVGFYVFLIAGAEIQ